MSSRPRKSRKWEFTLSILSLPEVTWKGATHKAQPSVISHKYAEIWKDRSYYYPHSTDGNIEAEDYTQIVWFTWLISNRHRIQTQSPHS